MMVKDGQLIFVPMAEGYREDLAYWNGMYKDGLLWDQSFTIGNNELNAMAQSEDAVYGSYIRHVGDYVVGINRHSGMQTCFRYGEFLFP